MKMLVNSEVALVLLAFVHVISTSAACSCPTTTSGANYSSIEPDIREVEEDQIIGFSCCAESVNCAIIICIDSPIVFDGDLIHTNLQFFFTTTALMQATMQYELSQLESDGEDGCCEKLINFRIVTNESFLYNNNMTDEETVAVIPNESVVYCINGDLLKCKEKPVLGNKAVRYTITEPPCNASLYPTTSLSMTITSGVPLVTSSLDVVSTSSSATASALPTLLINTSGIPPVTSSLDGVSTSSSATANIPSSEPSNELPTPEPSNELPTPKQGAVYQVVGGTLGTFFAIAFIVIIVLVAYIIYLKWSQWSKPLAAMLKGIQESEVQSNENVNN